MQKSSHTSKKFAKVLGGLEDKNYLYSMIAYLTAPTIELQKPSNLITFSNNSRNQYHLWERYKEEITDALGLCYFELCKNEDKYVVLFYNPILLNACVFKKGNLRFLEEFGYFSDMCLEEALGHLSNRFASSCPHELGVFLGIPVLDVIGFIANAGRQCLICKYWKVYHNLDKAKCTFEAYDRAKEKMVKEIINAFYVQTKIAL